jgi:hypothetical protein
MTNNFNEIIRPRAMELLKRAKLPDDQTLAGNQKNVFLNELSKYNYQNDLVYDSKDFPVTDPHGWSLTIDQFLKSEFDKYFEVSNLPINETECIERLKDPKITPSERKKITDHWNKLKTR